MQLKKELNLLHVFSISTGAMISSGLFVLPGLAYAKAGPAMILAYLLAALLVIPSMLAKAELSTAMPKAGGTYFFIERSLGSALGTFGGFANWFSLSLKSAFALVGIGAFAELLFPDITDFHIKMIAVSACVLFTIFNLLSVKLSGRIQIGLVIILVVILILYISGGFVLTEPDRYVPFMPSGIWSVFSTAGLVFVSYGGLTKIASIAEEVKNPTRNIPLGMLLSFTVVTLLYALAVAVTVGIADRNALSGSRIPLSLGANTLAGPAGGLILGIAAITAFITTANSGILSASRSPLAMSRDHLIPKLLSRIHPKFKTPYLSILLTSAFMIIVILFLSIENLVKTASTLMIILFMMVNISVIVMRESRIQNYQPKFRVPLYPWLPILALLFYGFLLVEMGLVPLLISGGFLLFGLISFWAYSRVRVNRTSALMHIVERISAKELSRGKTLEKELKEIVIERDEIIEDRFDRLIQQCEIMDLEESVSVETVFLDIAKRFSEKLGIDEEVLYESFMFREKESGTIIKPGLAIPHVIVPGHQTFEIMLVRCREGIPFTGASEPVHTMFVLLGSMDERNYHLRALMAIAYIAQEPDFERKWLAARNKHDLRDVILLSNRKRDGV